MDGLYLKSASTRFGWLPLLTPKNDMNWFELSPLTFTPTLVAFATLVVLALIQTKSVPSDDNSWPDDPKLPSPSRNFSLTTKSLTVAIPVTSALRQVISSRVISPANDTSLENVAAPSTVIVENPTSPDLLKSYANTIIPFADPFTIGEKPPTTEGDKTGLQRGDKNKVVATPETGGTGGNAEGAKQEINEDRINETKQRYYKLMGIDKMNKDAVYDSLIDASKVVQQEGADLKGAIRSGSLQTQIIDAISKNLDKSADLKKQIDAAILKGEIEKDIKASDPSAAVDLAYKKAATAKIQKDLEGTSAADVLATAEITGKNLVTSNTVRSILESKGTKVDFAFPDDKYQKWEKNNQGKDEIDYLTENYGSLEDGTYVVNKKAFTIKGGSVFPVDLDKITG